MFDVTPEPKRTGQARASKLSGGAAPDNARALSLPLNMSRPQIVIALQAAVGNKVASQILSRTVQEPMVLRQAAGAPTQTTETPKTMTDEELWQEYQDLRSTLSEPISTPDRDIQEQRLSALEAEVTRRLPTASIGSVEALTDRMKAGEYSEQFHRRQMDFLIAVDRAKTTAIENYSDIAHLKDPPSLAIPILLTALSAGFAAYAGWELVRQGIAGGSFAVNSARLSSSLGARIGTRGRSLLTSLGPSARDLQIGAKTANALEKIVSPGDPGQDVVTTAMEISDVSGDTATTMGVVAARERTLAQFGEAQARLLSGEEEARK